MAFIIITETLFENNCCWRMDRMIGAAVVLFVSPNSFHCDDSSWCGCEPPVMQLELGIPILILI